MSYETFPLTPQFPWVETAHWNTLRTPFESGAVQLRAKWSKAPRTWKVNEKAITESEAEELRAFIRDHTGGAEPFYITVADPVARPYKAPTLSQTVGGALGQHICYAKFTWSDSSDNETLASVNYGTLTVASGYLLTVTVPDFPENVTKAWVYVGPSSGTQYRQTTAITTTGGTWTEPVGGYGTGGSAPPSTNAFTETATVHFAEDDIEVTKIHAGIYSVSLTVEEVL